MSLYPPHRPAVLGAIPSDDAGVRATLAAMARLVKRYKTDAGIHELARRITANLPPQNTPGAPSLYVSALQAFVRDHIRYVQDVEDVETLQTPIYTLQIAAGDCDDKAVLLDTLLANIGYSVLFFAVGIHGQSYSHVLAGVKLGTRQVPLETIVPGMPAGVMPPGVTSVLPWSV